MKPLALLPLAFLAAPSMGAELLGLPAIATCSRHGELANLGDKLFRDAQLSADGRVSCATCHRPDRVFADGLPLAKGNGGSQGTRNTPSLINTAWATTFAWDGRRASLEDQIFDAFVNPREHGLPDHAALVAKLKLDPSYAAAFRKTLPENGRDEPVSLARVG